MIRLLREICSRPGKLRAVDLWTAAVLKITVECRRSDPRRVWASACNGDHRQCVCPHKVVGFITMLKDKRCMIEIIAARQLPIIKQCLRLFSPGTICGRDDFPVDVRRIAAVGLISIEDGMTVKLP